MLVALRPVGGGESVIVQRERGSELMCVCVDVSVFACINGHRKVNKFCVPEKLCFY